MTAPISSTTSSASVELAPVAADLTEQLASFLTAIDGADRTFLDRGTDDPAVARRIAQHYGRQTDGTYVVAIRDRVVVGFAGVTEGAGWSRHVGHLRVVVDPASRRSGVGALLVMAVLAAALDRGLAKVVVEVRSDQQPVIALFTSLGFQAEALLTDHLRDPDGRDYDLITLAHRVDEIRGLVTATGLANVDAES